MSLVNFIQGECELTSGDASDVPTEAMLASLVLVVTIMPIILSKMVSMNAVVVD